MTPFDASSKVKWPHAARTPLIMGAILVAALLVPAAENATAAQTVTFAPVADTYVRADRPTATAGTSSRLRADAVPINHTFLRFDLSAVGDNVVQSATLRLHSTTDSGDGGTVAYVTNDTWAESSLNWASAPTADSAPTASLGPATKSTWVSTDVTDLIAGDRIVSLRVSSSSAAAAVYVSRNGTVALRPQLVVIMSPPDDTTAPTVSITQPTDGSLVRGIADVAVDASDTSEISSVTFTVDGAPIGTDVVAPYLVEWDSRGATDGSHTLSASATDPSGNVGTSAPVTVTVDNSVDQQNPVPPTSLTATPLSPSRIDLAWSGATDNVGIDHYIVFRDGTAVAEPVDPRYLDIAVSPSTTYAYSIVAVDAAGLQSAASDLVTASTPARSNSFTFAAAGDHGGTSETAASLAALDASPAEFYLALGDMDYDAVNPDSTWCQYVTDRLPSKGPTFPFQLVSGNHEQQGATEGYILNHTACLPDRLSSVVAPGSVYGAEYYFDYPAADPLMRVVMLPPLLKIDGVTYTYEPGSPHRAWLSSIIDEARAAGIPWITVGTHYQCPTIGEKSGCSMGTQLWNLLVGKRVDLILTAHDHVYERSKQLALDSTRCPSMSANTYQPGCIVDDGSDGQYPKAAGSVNVVAGTFGMPLDTPNPDDPEARYFATADGRTHGFVQFTVARDRIDAQFVPTRGTGTDAFTIVDGAAAIADTTPPTTPTGLMASTVKAARVDLAWTPGQDAVEVAQYAVYRDGVRLGTSSTTEFSDSTVASGMTYRYTVRAYDDAGNGSADSAPVTATTQATQLKLTFPASSDATVRAASPTGTYGTSSKVEVDNSPINEALLKFDVSGLAQGEVAKATLRLYCINASGEGGSVFSVDNNWNESSVTWNTAPPAGPTSVRTVGPVLAGAWYAVDLTPVVSQDGTYSFRISTASADGADYNSRQGPAGYAPELVVELWTPVAPSAL